jgi:betaine-aldehyde dehydrogenase
LCASVWTKTHSKAIGFANEIQAGFIWVNDHLSLAVEQPWGGFKQSGLFTAPLEQPRPS